MITLKEIKEKLPGFDTYSVRDSTFTVRRGFYYRMGKDSETYRKKVLDVFPSAKIVDSGEIYKVFRGGASIANQSHWFVKFTVD